MSTTMTTSTAAPLNVATVTQYLTSQTSLAASLTGSGKRRVVLLRSAPEWDGPAEPVWGRHDRDRQLGAWG